ncbi:MAG: recombinase family protein [Candidatus Omnitrophota bacterium]|jgi:DNA invertase Pin-like site-specific DNA recombinase
MEETQKQEKKTIRCAIYTRVSTSEGLEQEFTSLDNQRESAENYIQSQKSEGWVILPERYDDPGYTGANTDRPALQKLIADIKESKIDSVITYKVDRLSRSLLDFSKLLEFFEQNKVTFVSVTQAFNTNTSMGRLTLNILLSFAQFEREIISERTRDKMGAARKKGKWCGGRPPLGYDLDKVNHKLIINQQEAEVVRKTFELYLEKRSLLKVTTALNELGYTSKIHLGLKGNKFGGMKLAAPSVQAIIKNISYTGKVRYHGQIYQGELEPIVSDEIFQKAQAILADNRRARKIAGTTKNVGLLNSILHCKDCNSTMYYIYTKKGKNKYNYYLCMNAQKRGYKSCPTRIVTAQVMENKFMEFLRQMSDDSRIEAKVWETLASEEKIPILKSIAKAAHYDARNETLEIILNNADISRQFALKLAELKHIPHHLQQAKISKEPLVRQNLLLAHQIGRVAAEKNCSIRQIARWLGITHSRICHIASMLLISPQIQEEILLSDDKTLFDVPEYRLRKVIEELDWDKQQEIWKDLLKTLGKLNPPHQAIH